MLSTKTKIKKKKFDGQCQGQLLVLVEFPEV